MDKKEQKEDIDSGLRLIVKSSFIVFIGLLLSKILTYLYRIIIARNFGPEMYGVFSLAIMVLGWFMLFGALGFSEGALRYIPWCRGKKEYSKIRYILKTATIISFFSGIVMGVLLFLSAGIISINIFHNSEIIIFLKVFSILIPFYILNNIFLATLQALEKIGWYSFILNILQNAVKVISLFLLFFLGIKSNAIVFSYCLGILAMFFVSFFASRHYLSKFFPKQKEENEKLDKKETRKQFFSYSWPLTLYAAVGELFYWTSSFFIGYFIGVEEVGFYNAAVPIAMLLLFVPEIFLKLFFPLITRQYSSNKPEVVKQLSQQVGKWIFLLNLPIFVMMILFPGVIINFLFGSEYLIASNALRILAIGGFLSSLFWMHENLLSMIGKTKLIFKNLLFVSIINLILNLILVSKYGISGAAVSTTISKIIFSSLLFIQVKKHLNIIPFRRKIFSIMLIILIPTIITLILRDTIAINTASVLIIGAFFILVYFLLIFLTKSLDRNDIMVMKTIKNKLFNKK